MAEICHLHERLLANLRLGMSVFLDGHVRDAQKLLEEKARFRDLEHEYAANHIARLQDNTAQSIETSSLHLDLISELKRINSHICSIAYPILESAGAWPPRASGLRSWVRWTSPRADRPLMLSLADIADVFARKGHEQYTGEPVTQLEHALQTAHAGRAPTAPTTSSSPPACCTTWATCCRTWARRPRCAAWTTCTSTPRCPLCAACSVNACWAASGCMWTPSAACAPPCRVMKRRCRPTRSAAWRCRAAPSAPQQANAFMAQPGALDALQLRQWDDLAKTAGAATPPLQHYLQRAARHAAAGVAAAESR
jgi:hypothetical protein